MSASQKKTGRNKARQKHTGRLEHAARKTRAIRTCCPLRYAGRGFSRVLGGGDIPWRCCLTNGVSGLLKLMHLLGR
eukprot:6214037-Pleurochrysis_carterae.AAC.3